MSSSFFASGKSHFEVCFAGFWSEHQSLILLGVKNLHFTAASTVSVTGEGMLAIYFLLDTINSNTIRGICFILIHAFSFRSRRPLAVTQTSS